MKKLIFTIALISLKSALALDPQAMQELVEKSIKEHQQIEDSGVAVSVFTKNKILLQKGFGLKDRESKLGVTSKTLFAIGSTTKAFTALDLKLLENRHQLNFTDKIRSYFPDFQLSNEMISREATIEDLLSHRVGLPRHDLLWYLTPFSRRDLFSRIRYLDFPEKADENFRKTFQYNNLLFMTAGILVEEKSKMSWEEFTQKNILDVLHMDATCFGVPSNMAQLDVATPYYEEEKLNHKDLSQIGPAGSMYSNAEDMTKWIQSFMQKKWTNQEDFFNVRIALPNGENTTMEYGYGLGWMKNTMVKPYTWSFHDGNVDGFSTLVLFSPELDLGVVVMVNQNGSALPNDVITDIVVQAIKEKNEIKNKRFNNYSNISFFNPEKPLFIRSENGTSEDKVETFHHPAYGELSLVAKNGDLFANYYGNIWKLNPYNQDGFNYMGEGEFEIPFKIEEQFLEIPFELQTSNIHFIK